MAKKAKDAIFIEIDGRVSIVVVENGKESKIDLTNEQLAALIEGAIVGGLYLMEARLKDSKKKPTKKK